MSNEFKYLITQLYLKYGKNSIDIEKKYIEKLIKKKKSNYLSKYKDCLIYDSYVEYIVEKYCLRESLDKIGELAKYYKNYLSFFCRPFCTDFHFNNILENYYDNKAENFYNENFGKEETKENHINKKNNNNSLIFNETVKKSIENPTQSSLNLNSVNNDLNSILNEDEFLTSKTQKESLNNIINTLDKKIININKNYESINNENIFRSSMKGLFTIYKSNQMNNFLIGRENSPNYEKSKLSQFKNLKQPYTNNNEIYSKKHFSISNQESIIKNKYIKNSIKLNNKHINISLDSKKKGCINSKLNNKKSFSSKSNKYISSNLLSTYVNNCIEQNKYKIIQYKVRGSNSYKDNTTKNHKNTVNIKIKGNNACQPLSLNHISNIGKINQSLKKKNLISNKSSENMVKNVKSIRDKNNNENNTNRFDKKIKLNLNKIYINSNIVNVNNNNNNSLSNFLKKSRNHSNNKLKNLKLEKNVEINKEGQNLKISNKKQNIHSPNFTNHKKLKQIKGNDNSKKSLSKKTEKNILSCRLDSSKKKIIVFTPIDTKNY